MTADTPRPRSGARSRRARVISILVAVVVVAGFGFFLGQSYIPLGTVSDCTVTGAEEISSSRQGSVRYDTSCGQYISQESGIEVGGTYDFELRGLLNTNIVGVTAS
jgi:hypothetical protein